MNTEPHEPSPACHEYHCYIHNVDEPTEGFELCAECGHMFLTGEELVEADFETRKHGQAMYRQAHIQKYQEVIDLTADFFGEERTTFDPGASMELKRFAPEDVFCCPHCSHSF